MLNCMYCKLELTPQSVIDVCMQCGPQIWGGKMFASIIENMELARSTGNLDQGLVTEQESEKREVIEPYSSADARKPAAGGEELRSDSRSKSASSEDSPAHFLLQEAQGLPSEPSPAPAPTPSPEPVPAPDPQPEPEPRPEPEQAPSNVRVPSLFQDAIQHQQDYPEEEPPATEEAAREKLQQEKAQQPSTPTPQEETNSQRTEEPRSSSTIISSGEAASQENQLTGAEIDIIEPAEKPSF